jgi:putative ABC transport system ATP-binding protein
MKNKVNFIVGESGSGKSSLLKLLNLSQSSTSGELLYNNKPIESYDPIQLRRDISLVAQEPYLFNESIYDNFKRFYALRKTTMPSEEFIKYITNLCLVNIPLDQNALTLSGGERQRVYISIFLSFMPKVILLDEPTSALDEKNSHLMIKNIISFCKEKSIDIVIISHDKKIVDEFSENIVNVTKGE